MPRITPYIPAVTSTASSDLTKDASASPTCTATGPEANAAPAAPAAETDALFAFHDVRYYETYSIPADAILVGTHHLTRGATTVIGGVAGCGKSRLVMSLAISGMLGQGAEWMGLPVHSHFTTALLQGENGEIRIKEDLEEIRAGGWDLQGWLKITPPPRFGLSFSSPEFCTQLHAWLEAERPGVLAIDPWNNCTLDDKAKDYRAALDAVISCLPKGPDAPALVIVHHLRKPILGDMRRRGRDLLHELSGSHLIGSHSRCVFILEPATPDLEDDRLIFTCVKNNNGRPVPATAWHRKNGLFAPCEDFDWEAWESGAMTAKRRTIELEDLALIFEDGDKTMTRKEAVKALQTHVSGASKSSVYDALRTDGRFGRYLGEVGGEMEFRS